MKTSLLLAFGLFMTVAAQAAEIDYSNTADLPTSTGHFKMTAANFAYLPTRVRVERIPGCNPNGEESRDCTRVVVLEREPVVQANVSYEDSMFPPGDGNQPRYLTFNFSLSDFSDDDVAMLKAAYPTWKHPFSKAGKIFAKRNFILNVEKQTRTIQVIDMKRSKICPTTEDGSTLPGCVEKIVYKDVDTVVKEVTVGVNE